MMSFTSFSMPCTSWSASTPVTEGAVAEEDDGVAQLLALDLLLRAIDGAGRIAHRVSA